VEALAGLGVEPRLYSPRSPGGRWNLGRLPSKEGPRGRGEFLKVRDA
jgi:hypothetical protein